MEAAVAGYGLGPPSQFHEYRTEDGTLLQVVARWGSGPGKKIRPVRPQPAGWFQSHADRRPLPLYRLPEVIGADLVIVVEGEKDANAVAACGLAATTNLMGAGKASHTDWTPLEGKQIAIWPDPDTAGRSHAEEVGRLLVDLGCPVSMLDLGQSGFEFLRDRHGGDNSAAAAEIRSLIAAAPPWQPERPATDEPVEIVIGTDEHRVNDEVLEAPRRDPEIYQRAGELVHVVTDAPADDQVRRAEGGPRIVAAPPAFIRERMTRLVRFRKMTSNGMRPAHPPHWSVQAVMARAAWPHIRPLRNVVSSPVLRPDGSICIEPGYDRTTELLYRATDLQFDITPTPSQKDALAAIDLLEDIVCDFPFASAKHKAAWVAGLLTPLARYAFDGPAPLFLIDKNIRGCGGTLLADAIGLIVAGRGMSRFSNPPDDEEARKRITAIALGGDPLVLIDNIAGDFGTASLDAALTGTDWSDRILGRSEIVTLPLAATWYGTGNNIILAADTIRRVCHVRLESAEEKPEERSGFRYPDLRRHIREHQTKLLVAGLTILSAYIQAERPRHGLRPWGSFEGWSGLVREAIVWLGRPDPADTRDDLAKAGDTEAATLAALIHGWEALDPERRGLTASAVLSTLEKEPQAHEGLRTAIEDLCDGKPTGHKLGKALQRYRRRFVSGRALDRPEEKRKDGRRWQVIRSEGDDGDKGDNVSSLRVRETE